LEEKKMTKQNFGLVLFWIAVIWIVGWGLIGSYFVTSTSRNLTMDELNQTRWAMTGPWIITWGIFGAPVGAIVALAGMLLHSGAKGSTVLKYGLGCLLALAFSMFIGIIGHIPPVFGLGGTLILLCFIGILRLWAKERMALEGATTAADFRLASYVFFLMAAWFTCGIAGLPFLKAFEGEPLSTPLHVMVLFLLGWLFLFLSHYKARIQ
jgi:hypothetical protein